METLREAAWGGMHSDAPTAKQRKNFIKAILAKSYIRSQNKFEFIAGGNAETGYKLVCEAAYLILFWDFLKVAMLQNVRDNGKMLETKQWVGKK